MNISHTTVAALLPPDFKNLLHICCGDGEIIRHLAEQYDAFFTGVTEFREHLDAARRKNIGKAEFFLQGHQSLYFHNNHFDVVVSSEKMDDLKEVHRVLVPNGRLIVPCGGKVLPIMTMLRMKLSGFGHFIRDKEILIAHKVKH